MNRLFFWVLIVLVGAGVAGLAVNALPSFGFDFPSDGSVRLVYLVAVLLFVASAFVGSRVRFGQIVRGIVGWVAILFIALTAYAYRDELAGVGGRVLGVLAPGVPISGRLTGEAEGSVVIVRALDGHFAVRATANDAPLMLLVDTGASFVTLTPEDAASVGIDTGKLSFSLPIRTANGMIEAAPITIDRLTVGSIERRNVRALVAPSGSLHESLLGMSFLNTLEGYAISGDRMVLSP